MRVLNPRRHDPNEEPGILQRFLLQAHSGQRTVLDNAQIFVSTCSTLAQCVSQSLYARIVSF